MREAALIIGSRSGRRVAPGVGGLFETRIDSLSEGIIIAAARKAGMGKLSVVELSDRNRLKEKTGTGLISINSTPAFAELVRVEKIIRENYEHVLIGGQLPSLMPEIFLKFFPRANVFCGECEESMELLASELGKGATGNIYRAKPVNLKTNYVLPERSGSGKIFYSVELGRGCPYACDFCALPKEFRKIRTRDVEQVIDELDGLKGPFLFVDPNISVYPPKFLWKIFAYLEKNGKLWGGEGTAKELLRQPDLWDLMTRTCISFLGGVEDFDQDLKKNSEGILPRKNGAVVLSSYIIGLPQQTAESVNKAIARFRKEKLTGVFHIYTPYPNTVAWKNDLNRGAILDWDLSHYDRRHVVVKSDNLSTEKTASLFRKINWRAHTLKGTLSECVNIIRESANWRLATYRIIGLLMVELRGLILPIINALPSGRGVAEIPLNRDT